MDNENKNEGKKQEAPKLAEVKQFKKKEEAPADLTLSDAFRVMAENTEKGVFGTVRQFACVVDTVESGIVLIGPTDYAKMALVLQAGLQANIEDYMYGEAEEDR